MALEENVLTAITEAVRAAMTENPAQDAAAVAMAAATAAVAVRASPENIDAISQQIMKFGKKTLRDISRYLRLLAHKRTLHKTVQNIVGYCLP